MRQPTGLDSDPSGEVGRSGGSVKPERWGLRPNHSDAAGSTRQCQKQVDEARFQRDGIRKDETASAGMLHWKERKSETTVSNERRSSREEVDQRKRDLGPPE